MSRPSQDSDADALAKPRRRFSIIHYPAAARMSFLDTNNRLAALFRSAKEITNKRRTVSLVNRLESRIEESTGSHMMHTQTGNDNDMVKYHTKKVKKFRLCPMYAKMKTCANGSNCPFAHQEEDLGELYHPRRWRQRITQAAAQSQARPRTCSAPTSSSPERESNIDARRYMGRTDLLLAAANVRLAEFQRLLNEGANPFIEDFRGNDAMCYAILKNCPAIFVAILKCPHGDLPINKKFHNVNETYLLMAVKQDNPFFVSSLLAQGADPNLRDAFGKSPLFYAATKSNHAIIDSLCEAGADVNIIDNDENSPLDYMYQAKNNEILVKLVEYRAMFTSKQKRTEFLFYACRENHPKLLQALLNYGVPIDSIDEDGNNIVLYAYLNKQRDLCKSLLHVDGSESIFLLRNKTEESLLTACIKANDCEMLKAMTSVPAFDPNAKFIDRRNPLILATELGLIDVVNLLLEAGADPNMYDIHGQTPLIIATKQQNLRLTRSFFLPNVNLLIRDNFLKTAYQYAKQESVKQALRHYMYERNQITDEAKMDLEKERAQIEMLQLRRASSLNRLGGRASLLKSHSEALMMLKSLPLDPRTPVARQMSTAKNADLPLELNELKPKSLKIAESDLMNDINNFRTQKGRLNFVTLLNNLYDGEIMTNY